MKSINLYRVLLGDVAFTVLVLSIPLFAACSAEMNEVPLPSSSTARSVDQGDVVGFVSADGAHVWMGVPYAASTEGENRWRAPRPALRWTETRETVVAGPRCVQLTNEYDDDEGLPPGQVVGSEDCLTLDIYAPPNAEDESLPILVWIHGGGNVWGTSSSYDGSRLAVNENIVVVAVQYRLGPLGWFAHPLIRESAEQPHDAAASFAILDLIASLRWIKANIAVFGGNPLQVTIAGESHGGYNVAALLASPLAAGFFHRAIAQSGGFDSMSIEEAQGDTGGRLNASREIVSRLGARSADELRALPVEDLLLSYERGTGFVDVPRVIEDGVVLPASRMRSGFSSTSTFNAVPIILGTTLNEMKLFYARDERFIKMSLGVFPTVRDPAFWDLFTGYLTRLWRLRAVDHPAMQMHKAGHDEVYSYRFDWDDGGEFLLIDMKELFGASHGFEIPFLFNRFEHLGDDADAILFEEDTAPSRQALSRAMGQYWSSFIRDGKPSALGLTEWPAYHTEGGSFLRLDAKEDGGIQVINQSGDTLGQLLRDLNEDFKGDKQGRCLVVDEMVRWMYAIDIEGRIRQATNCETVESK